MRNRQNRRARSLGAGKDGAQACCRAPPMPVSYSAMPLDPALLRPFWYPVLPLDQLGDAPVAVELLGEALVLWRGADGEPHAAPDHYPHRSARLSGGSRAISQGPTG